MRTPDFSNLQAVLDRKCPARPTLFEFFMNPAINQRLSGITLPAKPSPLDDDRLTAAGFRAAGYDYVTVWLHDFGFPTKTVEHEKNTRGYSLNETTVISDRASFHAYPWQDPANADFARLKTNLAELPAGTKGILAGPGGVLENVIALVGYEDLCYMVVENPALAGDIFDAVGSRMVKYYQLAAGLAGMGAAISNDDWGFATQTMLSTADMRKYVFPWHKKIVQAIHDAGIPAILHSCGQLEAVMDDIIDDLKFDGKHSYEDKICPVEEAYEKWGRRIAILGGIDLDFVCRRTPAEIRARAQAMLDRAATRGSYALGTGNSVPDYVPAENYFALIGTATGLSYRS